MDHALTICPEASLEVHEEREGAEEEELLPRDLHQSRRSL
jgi:hypothetical protein